MSIPRSLCIAGLLCSAGLLACSGSGQDSLAVNPTPVVSDPGSPSSPAPSTPDTQQPSEPEPDSPSTESPTQETPSTETPSTEAPSEPAPRFSREWFVSPAGSDTAAGTKQAPLRTISKALTLVGPGEAIRVQAGTYAEKVVIDGSAKAGTEKAPITLLGEGKPRVTPVGGSSIMVKVQRPYWRIEGFEIDGKGQKQIAVAFAGDTEGCVFTGNELHGGSHNSGISVGEGAHGVTLEDNHVHDFDQGNVDSHGIVVAPTASDITIRGNDIHDNSGDSVQCLGPDGYSKDAPARGVLIEDNHLYSNRENAVDIKTCHDVTVRGNRVHGFRNSTTSRGEAILVHYSARNVVVEDNDVSDASLGIAVGGVVMNAPPTNISVRRNRIHDLRMPEGSGIRVENGSDVRVLHNTVTGTDGFALVLGHGTGGDSTNVVVRNNLFDVRHAVNLGFDTAGLRLEHNLYAPDSSFYVGFYFVPALDWTGEALAAWQQRGFDAGSVASGEAFTDAKTFAPGAGALDRGMDLGLPYCGAAPDLGAVEADCPEATASVTE